MIRLYRIARSSTETRLTWQSTGEHIEALRQILNFTPKPSHRTELFEQGYYAYVRGMQRERVEAAVLQYFRAHYSPPQTELTIFQSKQQVGTQSSITDFCTSIESEICGHFRSKGALVAEGGLGYRIFSSRDENRRAVGRLNLRRGVEFKLGVDDSNHLLLFTDVTHQVERDGHLLTELELRRQTDVDLEKLFLMRKDFATLDTDDLFQLCNDFVERLPKTIKSEFYVTSTQCSASDLGYETWLWSHELSLEIEVGNNRRVALAQSISEDPDLRVGLHTPPSTNLLVFLLHPSTRLAPEFTQETWTGVVNLMERNLVSMIPNREVPIVPILYDDLNDTTAVTGFIESATGNFSFATALFILVAPSESGSGATVQRDIEISNFTGKLFQDIRKKNRGSYTVTLDWNVLKSERDRRWAVENALLKGLTVLGAVPWRIIGVPFAGELTAQDVCFIGVDVNIYRQVPVVGGVIFDGYGIAKGYHLVRLEEPRGDHIGAHALASLLGNLLNHFTDMAKTPPKHIVIHRDGRIDNDDLEAANLLPKHGFSVDLVEIRKSGAPRIRQLGNMVGTPSRDIAVGNLRSKEVFLNTTLVINEQLQNGRWVFPAPDPLALNHRLGATPLNIIAGQVYALTLANYNSYRRTNRLPITTAYADALVNNAKLKPTELDFGKRIDRNTVLYWL
ncbi:MAG: hypothetical protein IPO91_25630 [Chloroflexi bacterium]|nr:hypothetical protein [Chloroflexota bacterium]